MIYPGHGNNILLLLPIDTLNFMKYYITSLSPDLILSILDYGCTTESVLLFIITNYLLRITFFFHSGYLHIFGYFEGERMCGGIGLSLLYDLLVMTKYRSLEWF